MYKKPVDALYLEQNRKKSNKKLVYGKVMKNNKEGVTKEEVEVRKNKHHKYIEFDMAIQK